MYSPDSSPFDASLLAALNDERSERPLQVMLTAKDDLQLDETTLATFPLLPSKHVVLFPGLIMPLMLRNPKYIQVAKRCHDKNIPIGVIAQKNSKTEAPKAQDIFRVGTMAKVLKVIALPDDNTVVIVQGRQRFQIDEIIVESPHLLAAVHVLETRALDTTRKKVKALTQSLKEVASSILSLSPEPNAETQLAIDNIHDLEFLTYFLSANIAVEAHKKQHLLSLNDSIKRANLLLEHLFKALEFTQLKQEIQSKVHTDIDQLQRDQYIRHHIRILKEELGDSEGEEVEALRAKGQEKKWPQETAEFFNKTLDKAERVSTHSPDYATLINHAELLLELPWQAYTKDNLDLKNAEHILNKDHFGLEKVKERVLEHLAVLKLKQDMRSPILCFYGPPGVGKTSLCKSIAKALNRKYTRISLGGISDEAEIRGHRKTYIGAMPGKFIQSLQKCQSSNPVFALDELDKISGMRGDPAAALLEVLDPEQNDAFVDNFLEIPYDLSKILFIATANSLDTIPPALRDRMEIIEINGYTVEEKIQIAKKHLFPKQRKAHGLKASNLRVHEKAINNIVESYTRESGVRELERKLGSVVRKVAKSIALEQTHPKSITPHEVTQLLGPEIFDQEIYQNIALPGVAIGLAWTPVGGEILFIEAALSRGKGNLTLSGQLGEIMKESATTALSYIKAHAEGLRIDHRIFDQYDLHIHVPAGAVPKDGPSAGITLCAALVSLYTQHKLKSKLAMTGEITLRGKILPVGGIKEKILAARRVGIRDIILSQQNQKDIQEIQSHYLQGLNFHYVDHIQAVLDKALSPKPVHNARVWAVTRAEPAAASQAVGNL